jgi:hypothetical protein
MREFWKKFEFLFDGKNVTGYNNRIEGGWNEADNTEHCQES